MVLGARIASQRPFRMEDFLHELRLEDAIYAFSEETGDGVTHYFHLRDGSTTLFSVDVRHGEATLGIDGMASWDDYKRFPYMLDALSTYLTGERYHCPEGNAFQAYGEEWIAWAMGEEVACMKAWLAVHPRYFLSQPLQEGAYVDLPTLHRHGVCLHSSTPRIYGYVHYLMSHSALPADAIGEEDAWTEEDELEVPQHHAIGRVKSWMLDGSETWESYAQEDVDLLLRLAEQSRQGSADVPGVVLNDVGTIHQMGIGVAVDGQQAAHWFREAYRQGDHWFAPTNLGDLYRKGCGTVAPDLQQALDAYMHSDDPYAWYRIGEAWEQEWIPGRKDLHRAMEWYRRAARAGHHLALKAMKRLGESV